MENGELNMHLCLRSTDFPTKRNEMRQNRRIEREEKNIPSKWQMLHIAKSDIIEFNVVKWFCSSEYLIHTQQEREREGEEQKKKIMYRMCALRMDAKKRRCKNIWIKVGWQRTVYCVCLPLCVCLWVCTTFESFSHFHWRQRNNIIRTLFDILSMK